MTETTSNSPAATVCDSVAIADDKIRPLPAGFAPATRCRSVQAALFPDGKAAPDVRFDVSTIGRLNGLLEASPQATTAQLHTATLPAVTVAATADAVNIPHSDAPAGCHHIVAVANPTESGWGTKGCNRAPKR